MSTLRRFVLASILSLSSFAWSDVPIELWACEQILDHSRQIGFHVLDPTGREVGTFEGDVDESGAILQNIYFFMQPAWRRQGLSRRFISRLVTQYPDLKEIRAALIYDNLETYMVARRTGHSREQSIKQTPFYKVLRPYGFTEIEFRSSVEQEDDADLLVTLRRR